MWNQKKTRQKTKVMIIHTTCIRLLDTCNNRSTWYVLPDSRIHVTTGWILRVNLTFQEIWSDNQRRQLQKFGHQLQTRTADVHCRCKAADVLITLGDEWIQNLQSVASQQTQASTALNHTGWHMCSASVTGLLPSNAIPMPNFLPASLTEAEQAK